MQIETHKQYDKTWFKLNRKQQLQVLAALKSFIAKQPNPSLRIHKLKGSYKSQYSFSAGGDLRVHYLKIDDTRIVLMMVGTHSQLYR